MGRIGRLFIGKHIRNHFWFCRIGLHGFCSHLLRGNRHSGVRIILAGFKGEQHIFTKLNNLASGQNMRACDPAIIYKTTIRRSQILQNVLAGLKQQPGMLARDFGIVDDNIIADITADIDLFFRESEILSRRWSGPHDQLEGLRCHISLLGRVSEFGSSVNSFRKCVKPGIAAGSASCFLPCCRFLLPQRGQLLLQVPDPAEKAVMFDAKNLFLDAAQLCGDKQVGQHR